MITKPSYWKGAKALDPACFGRRNLETLSANGPVGEHDWFPYVVPTYAQAGESCGGQCWANLLEPMLRRYVGLDAIPAGRQLNGFAVYFEAKRMFYDGCLAGGIALPEGFLAMKELGWIPQEVVLVEVRKDLDSIAEALKTAPVVHASLVTAGWFRPNPANGCIEEDWRPGARVDAGHAYAIVGVIRQDRRRFVVLDPCWGQGYGWYGLAVMSEEMFMATSFGDGPYTLNIEGDWATLLKKHAGWKRGLIATPRDGGIV